MQKRTIPCLVAAGFIGIALTASATHAFAAPQDSDVVVKGRKLDPETQRVVSFADLNLALRPDRIKLSRRIYRTADGLCFELNNGESSECTSLAVQSTVGQVEQAVARAYRKLAGLPVGPAAQITMVIGN